MVFHLLFHFNAFGRPAFLKVGIIPPRARILVGNRQGNDCLEGSVVREVLNVSAVFLENEGGNIQDGLRIPGKASPKRLHL